jgi:hypothetical protein
MGDVYFPEFESKFVLDTQIRETPDYVIQRWRSRVSRLQFAVGGHGQSNR